MGAQTSSNLAHPWPLTHSQPRSLSAARLCRGSLCAFQGLFLPSCHSVLPTPAILEALNSDRRLLSSGWLGCLLWASPLRYGPEGLPRQGVGVVTGLMGGLLPWFTGARHLLLFKVWTLLCFVQLSIESGGGLVPHQRLHCGQSVRSPVLFLRLTSTRRVSQIRPCWCRLPLISTSSRWSHDAHLLQIHFHSPLLQGAPPPPTPVPRSLLLLSCMVTFLKSIYSLSILLQLNFQLHRKERSWCSLIFKYLLCVNISYVS